MEVIIYLILAALLIAFLARFFGNKKNEEPAKEVPSDCCGAHDVCEATSLLSSSDIIEYYEDEDLDKYIDRPQVDYNDDDIEEFRDVLYTLKEDEVAGWMKSINLRKITLPNIIREEALMIVGDKRANVPA